MYRAQISEASARRSVKVLGLAAEVTKSYFRQPKNGGCDVERVTQQKDESTVVVFRDEKDVSVVLRKTHKWNGVKIEISRLVPRCAWVTLVMNGKGYAPGALAVAHSLKMVRTRHDLVCMVTDDVPHDTRGHLRRLYHHVIEVQYIQQASRQLISDKQKMMYNDWIDRSFTKWNCLELKQYDRVLFIDADMIVKKNCDNLFDLSPPASVFTRPHAKPFFKLPNAYLTSSSRGVLTELPSHGAKIPPEQVQIAVKIKSFVACGGLVLLRPDRADYRALLEFIHSEPVFGKGLSTTSGADEIAISLYYANVGISWSNIHRCYSVIAWQNRGYANPDDACILHYFGRPKPWEKGYDWRDPQWWGVVNDLLKCQPDLSKLFPERPSAATTQRQREKGMEENMEDYCWPWVWEEDDRAWEEDDRAWEEDDRVWKEDDRAWDEGEIMPVKWKTRYKKRTTGHGKKTTGYGKRMTGFDKKGRQVMGRGRQGM